MEMKCTLVSGKIVVLRDLMIKDKNTAAQSASVRSGGDAKLLEAFIQDEILKLLVVSIDGKDVKKSALEDLDSVFSFVEYQQLLMQIGEMIGMGKLPAVELMSNTGTS